ncbi:mechanosensitive ion channel protein MscS [Leucothrix arctica]|uniref:Mechanosensitive ion channel protein MscS n=1 Tax=Leucothrix arctica TaxID=1481894 RepID=A0A317CDI4_9GAMM|nr:mechanosensitive ion channel protein MscS [Leucothrix arctica]
MPLIAGYEQELASVIAFVSVICIAVLVHLTTKGIAIRLASALIKLIKNSQEDMYKSRLILSKLTYLTPAAIIYYYTPSALALYPAVSDVITIIALVAMVIIVTLILNVLIDTFAEVYKTWEVSKRMPLTSFIQLARILLFFLCGIAVVSVILNESPAKLFAGLGAMTAVLMLVFKDPIMGFAAGIQLSSNSMVAPGDCVEMPKYGVDGDIMEIGLTTVKVRNFDKTITTVPTQALIEDSFKNWRGMQETGGRRIKRAVCINLNSVRFCTKEDLERFGSIQYISEYIEEKHKEIAEYNTAQKVNLESLANGRRMTNIGVFRNYIEAYLQHHPKIHKHLTILVRQLNPTKNGLPVEIYAFTNDTNWKRYESIQSDIFDHILAVATEFDLTVFQNPSGADFNSFK